MTNERQPEAMRLADWLDSGNHRSGDAEIAAELRRLTRENAGQIGEIVALKEQRDELLAALKGVIEVADFHELYGRKTDAARAAIAKVGGAA